MSGVSKQNRLVGKATWLITSWGIQSMENWKEVWRKGVAPSISTPGLKALQKALESNDRKLIQGAMTNPPPIPHMQDASVDGACAIAYCGWYGDGLETVGEVEDFFVKTCLEINHRLGEPGGCFSFINWFDETPRQKVNEELLGEVKLEIKNRTTNI